MGEVETTDKESGMIFPVDVSYAFFGLIARKLSTTTIAF
jgi:hypothetical protein